MARVLLFQSMPKSLNSFFIFILIWLSTTFATANIFGATNTCDEHLGLYLNLKDYALESNIQDDPNFQHISHSDLENYVYTANELGQLVYKLSGEPVHTEDKQYHIGVWDFQDQTPGNIYGALEMGTDGRQLKHSSFNENKDVLSAWILAANKGSITTLMDGSGHYRPNPLSMYLILKKFQTMGLHLESTTLVFQHGLRFIRGIQISAIDFINAVESLEKHELTKIQNVKDNRPNLIFFLNFISKHTKDPFTKGLVLVYKIRGRKFIDRNLLNELVHILKTENLEFRQIMALLRSILKKDSYNFLGSPLYKKEPQSVQSEYTKDTLNYILKKLDEPNHDPSLEDQIKETKQFIIEVLI